MTDIEGRLKNRVTAKVPNVEGWGPIDFDGAVGKLERNYFDEKITVRFNINSCFPNHIEQQIILQQGHRLKCRPDFEVLVEKNGTKMFCNCIYGPGDEFPQDIRDHFSEAFDVMAVTIYREENQVPYILEPNFELLQHIVNFLVGRGIDRDFIDKMAQSATQIHENAQVQTLQDFKTILFSHTSDNT